jgi:hypothetical protein
MKPAPEPIDREVDWRDSLIWQVLADGRAIVNLDSDLQDPPELIPSDGEILARRCQLTSSRLVPQRRDQ